MKNPAGNISVIIPTFNRKDSLLRAIGSVQNQTVQPSEIIVVDDGSTDETALIISKEFPDIRLIQQEHSGVSAARNTGIKYSNFEWIAFLDSDDEWLPQKLEYQIDSIINSELKLCHTNEIWIRNGKQLNQKKVHKKSGGNIFKACLARCVVSPSTVMIHRSIFLDCGLFDVGLPACEDYDLWLRICYKYKASYVEEPMINKYGGHEDQLSQKFWGMDRFRIEALEKLLQHDDLSKKQTRQTLKMLLHKLSIFINGAQKRSKYEQAIEFSKKHDYYANKLNALKAAK